MGQITELNLTTSEKELLTKEYRANKKHCIRMRCKAILLKSEGKSSKDIGLFVEMSHITVNSWVKRYKSEGVMGLYTRSGRGRKPILKVEEDKEAVLKIIKDNRQRMDMAKADWEEASGKTASKDTFRRFLKSLADDTNG